MGIQQFLGSLQRIARNPYIDRVAAVRRHLDWQRRRALEDFPLELTLSESVLVATHGRCGVSALVNAHGLYDYNNMTLLKRLLMPGGVFIDVGANVGAYTLVASEQPRATVLAFEPHPATFALMIENLRRNSRSNVIPHCAAAGDRSDVVRISDTPGSSTTHVVAGGDDAAIEVPMLRLDMELEQRELTADVIKIDVEGFEYEVLRGMGEQLSRTAVVFVEVNGLSDRRGAGRDNIYALLRDAGLEGPYYYDARECRCRSAPVHDGEDPVFVNRSLVKRGLTPLDCSALGLAN
ncbi:MAG: FkbM family methyltransferase [Pseudomonadota bacterium]